MIRKPFFILALVLVTGASTLLLIGFQASRNKVVPAIQIEPQLALPSASPTDSSTTMKVPAPGYEGVPEMVVNTTPEDSDLDSAQ